MAISSTREPVLYVFFNGLYDGLCAQKLGDFVSRKRETKLFFELDEQLHVAHRVPEGRMAHTQVSTDLSRRKMKDAGQGVTHTLVNIKVSILCHPLVLYLEGLISNFVFIESVSILSEARTSMNKHIGRSPAELLNGAERRESCVAISQSAAC